jgi:hypothetical protein
MRQAGIECGPVFRKVNRGENVQKARPEPGLGGVNPEKPLGRAGVHDLHRYGAHFLRSRFATTAFDNGVPELYRVRLIPNRRGDKGPGANRWSVTRIAGKRPTQNPAKAGEWSGQRR